MKTGSFHSPWIALVLLLFVTSLCESVNVTKLLIQYVSVCGPKLCNLRHRELPVKFNHVYKDYTGCAECSCDNSCWTRGNCCPDVYLSFPVHSCVNNTILHNTYGQDQEIKYLMIDHCSGKKAATRDHPTIKGEQLRNLPVTTSSYNFTFRSGTVAKCHNSNPDYNWFLGFQCPVLTDFNYLSSFAEVEDAAIKSHCRISFHPHEHKAARCKHPSRDTVLNKCNMTGNWASRDEDIEWACGYYGPEVMQNTFGDIFCYICNPSVASDNAVISNCNATGLWDLYDRNIELACSAYPMMQLTYPYKNYFCRFCNRPVNQTSLFIDADSTVDAWPTKTSNGNILYRYFFKETKFNSEFLQRTLTSFEESRVTDTDKTEHNSLMRNGINITNLLFQYYLTTGYYDLCQRDYLKVAYDKSNSSCVCDARCLFNQEICCVDLALVHSTCVNELQLSPLKHVLPLKEKPNEFVAITGCLAKGNNSIYIDRCRNQSRDMLTIYDVLPVENSKTSLVFENIFCALCGQDSGIENMAMFLRDIDPFNVEFLCERPLPYENDIFFYDVIQRAKAMKCRIRTEPKKSKAVCKMGKSSKISKCNAFHQEKDDVMWGCENTSLDILPVYEGNYKNVFCKTCTPNNLIPAQVKTCPPFAEPGLKIACEKYPAIQALFPFKNALCRKCISPTYKSSFLSYGPDVSTPEIWTIVPRTKQADGIRNMFSPFIRTPEGPSEISKECGKDQWYDSWKDKCRNVLCYPGKYLDGGKCVPLLTTSQNLSYALSYKLEREVTHIETSQRSILQNMAQYVKEHLVVLLDLKDESSLHFLSFYVFSDQPCDQQETTKGKALSSYLLKATVHVTETVDRMKIEKALISLPGQKIKIYLSSNSLDFTVANEETASNLDDLVQKAEMSEHCYVNGSAGRSLNKEREFFRVTLVSDILLCNQVELQKDEFEIDMSKNSLKIHDGSVVLNYKEFMLTGSQNVRICADRLPVKVKSNASPCETGNRTLSIFTIVVISISLVSLIPPFVTYWLFPKLRTLPGLNSVALFVSLFAVQFLFVIQFAGEMAGHCDNGGFCITIGILLHLAWLIFFSWTFICSLHLFVVFVYSDLHPSNDANRLTDFRRYVVCSILFPVIIVALNIILTAAITKGDYIGYGGARCFVSNTIGIVLSFIVPVGVICIINTVFFFMTFRKIPTTSKLTTNQKDQNSHFKAFLKLFVLTGATWMLQIIDGFLPLSPFSYIVTLLNGSQGLFILVLFVCNSVVFDMYRNFHKSKTQKRPGQSYSSTVRKKYKNLSKSISSSEITSNNTVSLESSHSYDNVTFDTHSEYIDTGYSNCENELGPETGESKPGNNNNETENDVKNPETSSVNSQSCDSIAEITDENTDDTSTVDGIVYNGNLDP